jgi:type III secretory pathway component EscV
MIFPDLQSFIAELERQGELVASPSKSIPVRVAELVQRVIRQDIPARTLRAVRAPTSRW